MKLLYQLGYLVFIGILLLPYQVKAKGMCIGDDFEQISSTQNVIPPNVNIEGAVPTLQTGQALILVANAIVDTQNGGHAFFTWCTDNGILEYVQGFPYFDKVRFIASEEGTARIGVRVGDTLGYVNVDTVSVEVVDKEIHPVITPGMIKINGQPITSNWTDDGIITFNLYDVINKTFDTFWQPIKLEINNANGQEIYSGCYPFKDVCVDRWYTRPVMKLWKEGIVQGYENSKLGIFGPHNHALRAELIAATVRAKELGFTPKPLTEPPFADVNIDDWFAVYVQYAKNIGLIQGCVPDSNLFCPADPISRAAGIKVVVAAFLSDTLAAFENGRQPSILFLDVTDPNDWFYPYIYAAQAKNVVHGYSDGNFKPGQNLTRAEMAKMICIAAFGAKECAEMGKITGRPFIFAVTPEMATLNEATLFTVVGRNLSDAITFELTDCANITPIAGGTAEERLFQCTPSNTGGVKNGTLRYNEGYTVFSVNVVEQVVPEVTSVSPDTATLNQLTSFTVVGSDLPDDLAFELANCTGITALSRSAEQQQFQCTPTQGGSQEGAVTDASGARLKVFFVDVVETVEPPPITDPTEPPPVTDPTEPPPDTSCTPSVDRVEPLTVTVSEPATFTVYGSCLPETTAFFVGRCQNMTSLGGTETQRQFRCTPSHSVGIQDDGVVKDEEQGNELFNFSVNVEWGTPKVTSVTPTSATLNELTEFLVTGTSLTDEIALWIGYCEGMENLYRETEEQKFHCTPNSTGTKDGVVKDKPGGTILHDFTVDVN